MANVNSSFVSSSVAAELVAEFPVVRGHDAGGRGVHGEMRAVVVVLRVPFEAVVVPVEVLVAAGFGVAGFLVRDGEPVSEAGGGLVGWRSVVEMGWIG